MAIHWKDGIHGEERSARQQREGAVKNLMQARRGVAGSCAVLLLSAALIALWFAAGAYTYSAISAAWLTPAAVSLQYYRAKAAARRGALAEAQERYDAVFARLVEHETNPDAAVHDEPDQPAAPDGDDPDDIDIDVVEDYDEQFRATYRRHPAGRGMAGRNLAAMLPALRPATPTDYQKWLTEFLKNGRGSTRISYVNWPMESDRWYVATRTLPVRPLYGASHINVIVPGRIRDDGGDTGHSTLYMTGGRTRGFHNQSAYAVYIYSDTQVEQ